MGREKKKRRKKKKAVRSNENTTEQTDATIDESKDYQSDKKCGEKNADETKVLEKMLITKKQSRAMRKTARKRKKWTIIQNVRWEMNPKMRVRLAQMGTKMRPPTKRAKQN